MQILYNAVLNIDSQYFIKKPVTWSDILEHILSNLDVDVLDNISRGHLASFWCSYVLLKTIIILLICLKTCPEKLQWVSFQYSDVLSLSDNR